MSQLPSSGPKITAVHQTAAHPAEGTRGREEERTAPRAAQRGRNGVNTCRSSLPWDPAQGQGLGKWPGDLGTSQRAVKGHQRKNIIDGYVWM